MQYGRTPLDFATTVDCITAMLDAGANPGSPNALLVAAAEGDEPLVRRLLATGAPANAPDGVSNLLGSSRQCFTGDQGEVGCVAGPYANSREWAKPKGRHAGCRVVSPFTLAFPRCGGAPCAPRFAHCAPRGRLPCL